MTALYLIKLGREKKDRCRDQREKNAEPPLSSGTEIKGVIPSKRLRARARRNALLQGRNSEEIYRDSPLGQYLTVTWERKGPTKRAVRKVIHHHYQLSMLLITQGWVGVK